MIKTKKLEKRDRESGCQNRADNYIELTEVIYLGQKISIRDRKEKEMNKRRTLA